MTARREFSLSQANATLPEIRTIVHFCRSVLEEVEDELSRLYALTRKTQIVLAKEPDDSHETLAIKQAVRGRLRVCERGWNRIEDLGALVKDARSGTVDFPGQHEGRSVYFCWAYDEPSVGHFHEAEPGMGELGESKEVQKHGHAGFTRSFSARIEESADTPRKGEGQSACERSRKPLVGAENIRLHN